MLLADFEELMLDFFAVLLAADRLEVLLAFLETVVFFADRFEELLDFFAETFEEMAFVVVVVFLDAVMLNPLRLCRVKVKSTPC